MSRITRRTVVPVNQITPLTYRDGVTYIQLLHELSDYIKTVLHPSLQHTVDQLVADVEHQMDTHRDQYVDGVQEFQRIHDAFMSDVNAHLMALNDGAVSDLIEDDTSKLGSTLRDMFGARVDVERTMNQLHELESNVRQMVVNVGQEPYNVVDGDDVTAILTEALYDVNQAGGGVVYVPDGQYWIDPLIGVQMLSNTTLHLSARTTLRAYAVAAPEYRMVYGIDVENVVITGRGTIQGERYEHTGTTGEWGMGIEFRGTKNLTIENITIKDCWGDGIVLGASDDGHTNEHVEILNVEADNNRRQGISILTARDVVVSGCTLTNMNGTAPQSGIDVEPWIDTQEAYDIRIIDNIVRGSSYGILIVGKYGPVRNVRVSGNTVDDHAINGIHVDEATDIIIENNDVRQSARVGVDVARSGDVLVKGNKIGDSGRVGMHPGVRSIDSHDIVVDGNTIRNTTGRGIMVENGSEFVMIQNNTVTNSGSYGIHFYSPNDTSQYHSVANNTIIDCLDGIVFTGVDVSRIVANMIVGAHSTSSINLVNSNTNSITMNVARRHGDVASHAIRISADSDHNTVTSNDVFNATRLNAIVDQSTTSFTDPGNRVGFA